MAPLESGTELQLLSSGFSACMLGEPVARNLGLLSLEFGYLSVMWDTLI